MTTHTLRNWDGHEVKSPSLPERFKEEEAKHPDATWFISEGEFEVDHVSGCDYWEGPWSETNINIPPSSLKAILIDEDGEDMMEIELFGNEAVNFIGFEALIQITEGSVL